MTLVRTVGDVTRDPIVVVGMGCRFPGGITSADELWQAVIDDPCARSGKDESHCRVICDIGMTREMGIRHFR